MHYRSLIVRFVGVSLTAALATLGSGCAADGAAGATEEKPIVHDVTADDIRGARSTTPLTGDGVVLYVNGMGCPLCASNIDKQLKRIAGVDTIDVDLSVGRVTLAFKGTARPSPYVLGEAVADAGFTLVKVEGR